MRKAHGTLNFNTKLLRKKSTDGWTINVPVIYGVLNQRYLISVSDPFFLKNSISMQRLLEISPPNDLYLFELWENIALASLLDLRKLANHSLNSKSWEQKWGSILHGEIMRDALKQYMLGGSLSKLEQSNMLEMVPNTHKDFPPLAENIVLRLIGVLTRSRCSPEQAIRTLRSQNFRENLSYEELSQILVVYQRLKENSFGAEASINILETFFEELSQEPFQHRENPSEFEIVGEQSSVDEFSLFLQEFAGDNNPLPSLKPQ